jgi:hypothetical protein
MGIYLYGELATSGRRIFKNLARKMFQELKPEMDNSTVENIKELLS